METKRCSFHPQDEGTLRIRIGGLNSVPNWVGEKKKEDVPRTDRIRSISGEGGTVPVPVEAKTWLQIS